MYTRSYSFTYETIPSVVLPNLQWIKIVLQQTKTCTVEKPHLCMHRGIATFGCGFWRFTYAERNYVLPQNVSNRPYNRRTGSIRVTLSVRWPHIPIWAVFWSPSISKPILPSPVIDYLWSSRTPLVLIISWTPSFIKTISIISIIASPTRTRFSTETTIIYILIWWTPWASLISLILVTLY